MRYDKKIIMLIAVTMMVSFFAISMPAGAAPASPLQQKVMADKQITGEVLSKTPKDKPTMITIGVNSENADYMLYVAPDMSVVHKKNLSEIQLGDTVRVRYYVVEETDEKGRKYEKSIAQTVTFIRSPSAIKGLRTE